MVESKLTKIKFELIKLKDEDTKELLKAGNTIKETEKIIKDKYSDILLELETVILDIRDQKNNIANIIQNF